MKVVHPKISSRIEISDQRINVLVIEAPDFLYEVLTDIKRQMDNLDGDTVLSQSMPALCFLRREQHVWHKLSPFASLN